METTSSRIEAMKTFTEYGLTRLEWDLRKIDQEAMDCKVAPESNTVRWILRHISTVLNVYLPRAFTGNLNYLPEKWPDNYQDNDHRSLETILADIAIGHVTAINGFNGLTEHSLEETLDWYIGEVKREMYLMILSSEILHHEGQIASIIGLRKRISGEPPEIIPPEA